MKRFLGFIVVAFLSLLLGANTYAQTEADTAIATETTVAADTTGTALASETSVDSETVLEGVEVEVPKKAPGNFGIWWRGFREKMSLVATVDPVKKAEKQVKFAEERIRLAEKIAAESDDPEAEAKAEAMIAKANEFIQKVEDKKDKFLERPGVRTERLLKNIATHTERREQVLDRIEDRLPEEKRALFEAKREELTKQGGGILRALANDKLPEEVKAHLEEVKARIEANAEVKKEFREEHKALLEQAVSGDEAAKTEIDKLRMEWKDYVTKVRTDVDALKLELKEKATAGDKDAALKLRILTAPVEDIKAKIEAERELREEALEEKAEKGNKDAAKRLEEMKKMEDRKLKTKEEVRLKLESNGEKLEIRKKIETKMEGEDGERVEMKQEVRSESTIPAVRALQRTKVIQKNAEKRKEMVEKEMEPVMRQEIKKDIRSEKTETSEAAPAL